jgi:glycerophosphoryl diester phosphodiesterase
MPWPEMIHAMVSTRRAFAASWSTNGPGPTRPLHDLVPGIRLHQSLPAFTGCSLDHSPGDGDHADAQKGGGINLYPRWDPETIVDERDRWEMTVYLSRECPGEEATLDLTPRRCQKFRAGPGELFRWIRTSPGENRPLQRGESRADRWGLVTLKGLRISRKKQRIILVRAAAPSGPTGAMPPVAETGHGRSPELKVIAPKTAEDLQELFRYTGDSLHLVSAHRGGPGKNFPENCIATFEHTLQSTFALMEVDPRYTKDGAIVLHHDATLERTTSGRGAVADSTLEELRKLRLRDPEGRLTGYSIPTLDEALEWARGKTILVLDQKDVPLEERIRKIEEHGAEAFAMLIVYSLKDVKLCHARNGNILMEVMISSRGQYEAFDRAGIPWKNIVAFVGHSPPEDLELLKMIHARGASCMAGTSRNIDRRFIRREVTRIEELERDYRALLAKGVDLIETDLPREVGTLLFTGVPDEK